MPMAGKKLGAYLGLMLLALSFFAGKSGVEVYTHHESACADHHQTGQVEHCHDTESGHDHKGDADPVAHCHSCPASLVNRFESFFPSRDSLDLAFSEGIEVYRNPYLEESLQPPRA